MLFAITLIIGIIGFWGSLISIFNFHFKKQYFKEYSHRLKKIFVAMFFTGIIGMCFTINTGWTEQQKKKQEVSQTDTTDAQEENNKNSVKDSVEAELPKTGFTIIATVNNEQNLSFSYKVGEAVQQVFNEEKLVLSMMIDTSCFSEAFRGNIDCLFEIDFLDTVRHVVLIRSIENYKNDFEFKKYILIDNKFDIISIDLKENKYAAFQKIILNNGVTKQHAREKTQSDFIDSIQNINLKI